jgi:hypothetical protein
LSPAIFELEFELQEVPSGQSAIEPVEDEHHIDIRDLIFGTADSAQGEGIGPEHRHQHGRDGGGRGTADHAAARIDRGEGGAGGVDCLTLEVECEHPLGLALLAGSPCARLGLCAAAGKDAGIARRLKAGLGHVGAAHIDAAADEDKHRRNARSRNRQHVAAAIIAQSAQKRPGVAVHCAPFVVNHNACRPEEDPAA